MVKTYLRYAPAAVHGLIASPGCPIEVDPTGVLAFSGQLEGVGVWHVKRGVQVQTLNVPGNDATARSEVTCLRVAPHGASIAVGYADGMIRIFDVQRFVLQMALNGHKKAVSALCFNAEGTQLISGSRDTDIILWDLVAESGVCRLRGHKDEVTSVLFLPASVGATLGASASAANRKQQYIVSSSKDTLLKVWDLSVGACVQTVVGVRSEVWSAALLGGGDRLVAGSSDNQLRMWAVGDKPHIQRSNAAAADGSDAGSDAEHEGAASGGAGRSAARGPLGVAASSGEVEILVPMGGLTRSTSERTQRVVVSKDGMLVAVVAAGKTVEVFRRRTPSEVRKRVLRRLRRHREKMVKRSKAGADAADDMVDEDNEADAATALELVGSSLAALEAEIKRLEDAENAAANAAAAASGSAAVDTIVTLLASDELELVGIVHASAKISSAVLVPVDVNSAAVRAAAPVTHATAQLLLALQDNQLEVHTLPLDGNTTTALGAKTVTTPAGITVPQAITSRSIGLPGHRSDIRSVAISSDNALVLSAGAGHAKVWNAKTGACLRTLDLGDTTGLCCAFAPANRHAVVGCKDGRLMLFDLASADLLEEHAAHTGAIWSLAIRPDGKGMCTGSVDKEVKLWEFDLVSKGAGAGAGAAAAAAAPGGGVKQLTLIHARTLKLGDEVLCVKYSHHKDGTKRLLAVALLDSTVKVFFEDTLRFALSLYGHKLPVMAMDISADCTLLVSASADKNVKLWGLDFGDCHRSFFAHGDSVTAVGFVANTHYFFTGSKDKLIKYYDGDRFEHILTLEGHKGEVWALAVSPDGSYFVTGSHDRSLRVWKRTEEQVFLEEEREKEFDTLLEKELRDPDGDAVLAGRDMVGPIGPDGLAAATDKEDGSHVVTASLPGSAAGPMGEASGVVAHATKDTQKGTDRLLEALSLCAEESDAWAEYAKDVASAEAEGADASTIPTPDRKPELLGLTPAHYILRTLRGLRPSDIDQVLLVLPFSDAMRLLKYLHYLLRHGLAIELCTRAALLLLRVHHAALVANQTHLPMLVSLQQTMQSVVQGIKDIVGFNIAGLHYLDKALAEVDASLAAGMLAGQPADDGKDKLEAKEIRAGKRRKVALL